MPRRTVAAWSIAAAFFAGAAETRLCAWLSVSTFAGLVAYAVVGWTLIDAVAGFVIAAFAVDEVRGRGRASWSAATDPGRTRERGAVATTGGLIWAHGEGHAAP